MNGPVLPSVRLESVSHRYGKTLAIDRISVEIFPGSLVGFIGPDGVGKSTLLGIIAGAKKIQSGRVEVLGGDLADRKFRVERQPRIAYMPQGLGKNLYQDLTIFENLEFFSSLFEGGTRAERRKRIEALLGSMGLESFVNRPVGKLSGGMKQKLGLCCALIHDPDLLILDEPTTGVDPLSRRQFWDLVAIIRRDRPPMTVLVATAYMEEAETFEKLVAMHEGKALFYGTPTALKASQHADSLEDAFVELLPEDARRSHKKLVIPPFEGQDAEAVIVTKNLTRKFGDFIAVDSVSIEIKRGEIFGFLGSNGCGKTTTMKMLTGLLPASDGDAWIFREKPDASDLEVRKKVGYMSQSFSLYQELSVRRNLELHAQLFKIPAQSIATRVRSLLSQFELERYEDELPEKLPLGLRQRLSLAVAVIHQPPLLILDEPTSGVDPVARDEFWDLLIDLSRNQGVTIFISTHFMNEGERCDRIALMHAGKILVSGPPKDLIETRGSSSLDDAFVSYITESIQKHEKTPDQHQSSISYQGTQLSTQLSTSESRISVARRRAMAYARVETLEVLRDPIRKTFAFLGTILLMLVLGYGINSDVENLTYAVLDRDGTPESRAYADEFSGSRYFLERPPLTSDSDMEHQLRKGSITMALEIPPGFGRDLVRNKQPEVAAWIDGSMPFRAETIRGYVEGLHRHYLSGLYEDRSSRSPINIQVRFRYNQDFKSVFAMAPGSIAMLLILIPAILTALGIVREKEMGSIANFYVTPVTRSEFLAGKCLPYIGISLLNYAILVWMTVFIMGVTLKGSLSAMTFGALLYVTATCGIGLLTSSFTKTQITALFATVVLTILPALQFSGILQPVSTLEGAARFIGTIYPTTHFLRIAIGSFAKALGWRDLMYSILALIPTCAVILGLSITLLREQDE